ncbi:MAG: hypothetical protein ACREPM_05605 [Gemmatimonadaceae bacterium]
MNRIYGGAVAAAFAVAAQSAGAQAATVTLLGYKTSVPSGWTNRAPASSSRLAEYTIANPDGSLGAEVIVYFFGATQGGNVAANLTRWRGQFSNPDGSPVGEKVTRDSTGAFPIIIAEYTGTYARGIGAGDANNAKPGQTLVAAIVETPHGTMFVQLFGPSARVATQRDALVRFVNGLRDHQ